jgi:hypothetical protein
MKAKYTGFLLIAVGAGLLLWGYNLAGGFEAKVTRFVTGSHTESVMWFYVGGVVCVLFGAFMAFLKK